MAIATSATTTGWSNTNATPRMTAEKPAPKREPRGSIWRAGGVSRRDTGRPRERNLPRRSGAPVGPGGGARGGFARPVIAWSGEWLWAAQREVTGSRRRQRQRWSVRDWTGIVATA